MTYLRARKLCLLSVFGYENVSSFILLILNSCVQVLSGSAFVAPTADTIVNYIPHSKALVLYLYYSITPPSSYGIM